MTHPLRRVRIGCVKYLNARPLIEGCDAPVVFDHPTALCEQLARGELDVALVSSFEFLRNPIYSIVDDVAIASDGPVYSVFVAHHGDITEARAVELDPASGTSVNLLRCLLAEAQLSPELLTDKADDLSPLAPHRARLLIGDQAIRFRKTFASQYAYWDLGEQWKAFAQEPFVYALWLVRPEVANAAEIAGELRRVRDRNFAKLERITATQPAADQEFCEFYYRKCLRFDFGENEQRGLRAFRRSCEKYQLLLPAELRLQLV